MKLSLEQRRFFLLLILAFILFRLCTMGMYPLFDTTESRYADIARMMAQTNNYLTPMFEPQVPFWGKPPWHTWVTALSFESFGINEFTARLPHLLASVMTIFTVFIFARHFLGKDKAMTASLILTSTLGFIVAGAMVMTDAWLTFVLTIAMASFWHQFKTNTVWTGLLFFIALALGMLIKGPVAIVIVAIALITWALYQRCLIAAIKSLPWAGGLLLFIAVCIPWYIKAEIATPGFLAYFLWGEHVLRFLEPGWQGDLYGSAHDEIKGTIWLFWLGMAFPWSFIAIALIVKAPKKILQTIKSNDVPQLNNYLLAWSVAPLLLFTLAGNILPAYVLPGIPAFALLISNSLRSKKVVLISSISAFVILVSLLGAISTGLLNKKTQAYLIKTIPEQEHLYYWQKKPFSANFYSHGQAKLLNKVVDLTTLIAKQDIYLVISQKAVVQLERELTACQVINQNKLYFLYQCRANNEITLNRR